jgi:hypothetical protein
MDRGQNAETRTCLPGSLRHRKSKKIPASPHKMNNIRALTVTTMPRLS